MTSQSSGQADLQSAIAGYMRQRPGQLLVLDGIARGVGMTRTAVSTMLCRIVNGEARDYPIERTGRATYTWIPLDDAAIAVRLARTIADLTGADASLAATVATRVLHESRQPAREMLRRGCCGWRVWCTVGAVLLLSPEASSRQQYRLAGGGCGLPLAGSSRLKYMQYTR